MRFAFLAGIALVAGAITWLRSQDGGQRGSYRDLEADPSPPAAVLAVPGVNPSPLRDEASCDRDELVPPTGRPVGLTCAQARSILQEIRERFAAEVPPAASTPFAEGVKSWLDPHGLWSASADAPVGAMLETESVALLDEIGLSPASGAPCAASAAMGAALVRWVGELSDTFDAASRTAPRVTAVEAAKLAAAAAFEDGDVTVPARQLSAELGRRIGALEQALGTTLSPFLRASRERFVPDLAAREWQEVVLAAAVRAYVSVIDPHGAWAPLDEEWSLYADDPSFFDDGKLWGDMLRTALGVRVVGEPTPPLEQGDLVLAIEGVSTAGLSVEQVEQLARAESGRSPPGERSVVVLRRDETAPRELIVAPPAHAADANDDVELSSAAGDADDEMALELVPYGRGTVAVVSVRYVGDDLGDRLSTIVGEVRRAATPPIGILLDLRGNGGGSTDGAAEALGIFQPGVPAFPLMNHGHVLEVLVAPAPAPEARWRGPVAVLVDGATASAAEMLAGALDRYRRGPLLGQRTYGKGCVQEYFRDRAGVGVLRLTTRLYTLPDGSPVQRQGLVPGLLVGHDDALEREADVPGSLDPSAGPDVRVAVPAAPGWPPHSGRVGPCENPAICAALRRVAGTPTARARPDGTARKRHTPRPLGASGR